MSCERQRQPEPVAFERAEELLQLLTRPRVHPVQARRANLRRIGLLATFSTSTAAHSSRLRRGSRGPQRRGVLTFPGLRLAHLLGLGARVAHHRGLVITLVVAVVVAAVGIGVLALTTNDTDEPVLGELSVRHYAESAVGWPSNDFGINVVNTTGKALKLIPKRHGGPCLSDNASVFLTNPNRIVELRVSRYNRGTVRQCTVADVAQRLECLVRPTALRGSGRSMSSLRGRTGRRTNCLELEQARVFDCTPNVSTVQA